MNFLAIVHYLGLLVAVVGGVMAVPAVYALTQNDASGGALASSAEITIICGGLMYLLTRARRKQLAQREVFLLVAASWITVSAFGALPYLFSGVLPNFMDAFFESMSGFTTTGASVFTHVADQPPAILLWRSTTQWVGGLGLITMFVSLFPLFGLGAARLLEAESPAGQEGERLTSRLSDAVRILFMIYFGFTFLQIVLLHFAGLNLFDSVNLSFCSVSTGGFAPTNLSVEDYHNQAAEIIIMIFMFLGGTNFALFYWLFIRRRFKRFFSNPELRLYTALIVGTAVVVSIDLMINGGFAFNDAMRQSSFNVVSVGTTTGFSSANFDEWPNLSRALILVLMVVGGSAGSTAGGLKVIRLLVLFKYAYRRILLAVNPSAVIPLKIGGIVLPEKTISRTIGMTVFYVGLLWSGFVFMSAIGLSFEDAISSVAACMASVGPGLGSVGPYGNYAAIPDLGKLALSFFMLAGRLEIFTLLVLFTPAFWRRY